MKKLSLFMLMAVGLLISSNVWADVNHSGTIDDPFVYNEGTGGAFTAIINAINPQAGKVYVRMDAGFPCSKFASDTEFNMKGAIVEASNTICFTSVNSAHEYIFSNFTLTNDATQAFLVNTQYASLVLKDVTASTKSSNGLIRVVTGTNCTVTIENCTLTNTGGKIFELRSDYSVLNLINGMITYTSSINYANTTNANTGKINWIVKGGYSGEFTSSTVPSNRTLREIIVETGGTLTVTSGTAPSITCNGGTTNVTGGKVTSLTYNGGSVSITGGTIMAGSNLSNLAAGSIKGGSFAKSGFTADEMAALKSSGVIPSGYNYSESGDYYVINEVVLAAKIGSDEYTSLEDAFNAVQSGQTIELCTNANSKSFDISGKNITITGNYTLGNQTFVVNSPATITVASGTTITNLITTGDAALTISNSGSTSIKSGKFAADYSSMVIAGFAAYRVGTIYEIFPANYVLYNITQEKGYEKFNRTTFYKNSKIQEDDEWILLTNVNLERTSNGSVIIEKNATINLNGNTITIPASLGGADGCIYIASAANVTFKNGNIVNENSQFSVIQIYGGSALTLENVIVENTILKGTNNQLSFAIAFPSTTSNGEGITNTLTLKGTTQLKSQRDLIQLDWVGGNVVINNYTSNFKPTNGGSLFRNAGSKRILTNATINNYGELRIGQNEISEFHTLTINNKPVGTFTCANSNFYTQLNNEGSLIIEDGYFDTPFGGTVSSVKGGVFTESVYNTISSKIASGKKGVKFLYKGNAVYRVVDVSMTPIANLKGMDYYYVDDALLSLIPKETATITLLGNAIVKNEMALADEEKVTINLNGHDIDAYSTILLRHAQLTLTGQGKYNVLGGIAFNLYGKDVDVRPKPDIAKLPDVPYGYVALTVDEKVIINFDQSGATAINILNETYPNPTVWTPKNYGAAEGVKVDIKGTLQYCNIGVNGYCYGYDSDNMGDLHIPTNGNIPLITIYPTAKIVNNGIAFQLGGYARTIFEGGEILGRVDVRAGEVIVNGGTFTNNNNDPVEFEKNDNGSAVKQGSCNITLAQHATKLPVIVNINGGTFKAVSPIAQGNPQTNDAQFADLMKCYINGGHFWSTSMTTDDILVSQEDNRIFATAGFYNEKPVDNVIAKGYKALSTETDYPTEWGNNYKWYIGLPSKEGETNSKQDGDWNSLDTWGDNKTPNENLEVVIKNDIILNGNGYAYGVKLEEGGKLTIQDGGTLIIGQGGVTGATIENLKIDGDGIFAIAPGTEFHPNASIDYVAKFAGKKKNVTEVSTVDQVYWEQMATPTIDNIVLTEPTSGCGDHHYYNKWDITEAWVAISKDEVNTPFKGYFMTNFSDYIATPKNNVYNFTGTLAGNKINPFGFNREGFTFFGNSCLAPMSIPELLMDLNKDDIQATIYVYSPLQGSYFTINMATVGRGGRPVEINKLQGFFIYAYKKTSVAPTYQDIIWNPLLAKQSMGGNSAPHKAAMAAQSEISSAATMMITSAMGWTDDVVLFEGANFTDEFDQNYDAQKMSGDHVNMYVPSTQNMAVYAVADLEGTPITIATKDEVAYTLSFSDVEGRDFELFDAETQMATKIQEGNTYEFVAPANSKIEYRFFIRKAAQAPTNNKTVRNAAKAQGIYNVMGAYMGEAKQWNQLPAGVYIVNGVRVVK